MKQKIFKFFIYTNLIIIGLVLVYGFTIKKTLSNVNLVENEKELLFQKELFLKLIKDRSKERLVNEVKNYMYSISPKSKLDPEYLTNLCIEYDMDIVFVISQGIVESHLGTKGKAFKTNSVWNVGTYDDGTILYRYKHPNNSIEPYLELLKRRYLKTKSIEQLLEDYTNDEGKRFASAKNYEKYIKLHMAKIDTITNISFYQDLTDSF